MFHRAQALDFLVCCLQAQNCSPGVGTEYLSPTAGEQLSRRDRPKCRRRCSRWRSGPPDPERRCLYGLSGFTQTLKRPGVDVELISQFGELQSRKPDLMLILQGSELLG